MRRQFVSSETVVSPELPEGFRASCLAQLNAREPHASERFDPNAAHQALDTLEAHAAACKASNARAALREVVRLLVAAAGHDLEPIRTRANVALERVFAPKPFHAPLATRFVCARVGERMELTFALAPERALALQLYPVRGDAELPVAEDLHPHREPMVYDRERALWVARLCPRELGAIDFTVVDDDQPGAPWLHEPSCSGRLHVLPDLRGELVLEIFTDIHGHTGLYWQDSNEHPGLVYNEHGEVIRTGTFEDVAAHLVDLKQRWSLTAIYLLGMQQRGSNREDWAAGARSPSPFAPLSLCEPDARLGGAAGFRKLVDAAHALSIKVIVDVVPHLNRHSRELPDQLAVRCYDERGELTLRASSDGRYGSWNDGKLLNYRKFAVWSWLAESVCRLIREFDVDGIRFDSAHALPIMMRKLADPHASGAARSDEDMVEGDIVSNEREGDHFATTGFYDCAAADSLAVPLHTFLVRRIEQTLRGANKAFFVQLAECYWGHERQLARSGVLPYNAALFKICEAIVRGQQDVRALYHLYDRYLPAALPEGAQLLGIAGNHDERRAVDAFGAQGLRAAVGLTLFLSEIVLDYEGNADGEAWKVFLDNIHLDWNQAASAAVRGTADFYRTWYALHRRYPERAQLIWANNPHLAAALKPAGEDLLLAAFNFSDATQRASLQFDQPALPIADERYYRVEDLVYSRITHGYDYFSGRELRTVRLDTTVSGVERIKLIRLAQLDVSEANTRLLFRGSFLRMAELGEARLFEANFAFQELDRRCATPTRLLEWLDRELKHPLWQANATRVALALKRALYHLHARGVLDASAAASLFAAADAHPSPALQQLFRSCRAHFQRGPWVFLSAEVAPFSRSGGLASVARELPCEIAEQGEDVVIITPRYARGGEGDARRMQDACERHGVVYSGVNVQVSVGGCRYEVGVHVGRLGRARLFMLDHHELFDGLYFGLTSREKLRRRIAFARAAAEVICTWQLRPLATFTNDAFAGLFNGIARHDARYSAHESFERNSFMHVIHNGGWQYFDAFDRYQAGDDLFALFDLPRELAPAYCAPGDDGKLHGMAAGVANADRVFTVSPSYAAQIERACDGLEPLLKGVVGISNGIARDFRAQVERRVADSELEQVAWPRLRAALDQEPDLCRSLALRYPELLAGPAAWQAIAQPRRRSTVVRMARKLMLQHGRGLELNPDKVLLVMIHRITEQKGFQLLLEASPRLFCELGYQAVIGGAVAAGDTRGEELARGLCQLQQHYPRDVSVRLGFEDVALPFLAADLVAMPSLHEPGGLVQLEALACGALVIARATGGLRDTIRPIGEPEAELSGRLGSGFLFEAYSAAAFAEAAARAAAFFRHAPEAQLAAARRNAELSAFPWERAALQYIAQVDADKELLRLPEGELDCRASSVA